MYRAIVICCGMVTVVFGLSILIEPKFYDRLYDYYWNFTEIKYPFGLFLVAVGILFIWSAVKKESKYYKEKFMICPKCQEAFNQKDIHNQRCPNCDIKLQDLRGFYKKQDALNERLDNENK